MFGEVIKYDDKSAVEFLVNRVRQVGRLQLQDNGIPPPTDDEIILALEDSFNYINSFPPKTNITPSSLLNDKREYLTMYCHGALHFIYKMLYDYALMNMVDVVIDEFPISSRQQEYAQLADSYKQSVDQKLSTDKQHMGSYITGGARQTSMFISFGGWISSNSVNRYRKAAVSGRYQ